MRIPVDTTVWVDFFNGKQTSGTSKLKSAIVDNDPVCMTPTVLQEVLQGFRTDTDYLTAKDSLLSFPILTYDPVESAIGAADMYRTLRKKGVTVRASNDCLIAFIARKFNCVVLSNDNDFKQIARHLALPMLESAVTSVAI